MIIEFKYKISDDIFALANKELVNFYDNYITGYLDEGDVHHLQHCSLYFIKYSITVKILKLYQHNTCSMGIIPHALFFVKIH